MLRHTTLPVLFITEMEYAYCAVRVESYFFLAVCLVQGLMVD
jgi:hypothetical protein